MLGNDGRNSRRSLFQGFPQRTRSKSDRNEKDDHQTTGKWKFEGKTLLRLG